MDTCSLANTTTHIWVSENPCINVALFFLEFGVKKGGFYTAPPAYPPNLTLDSVGGVVRWDGLW